MYSDPNNIEDCINKIKNAPTIGDVKKIMDDLYPTLFITLLDEYSDDYTDLNKNWNTMCDNLKVKKQKIIIFDNFDNDKCTLIKTFAELFTLSGFLVRCKNEIFPCFFCNKALPSKDFYDLIKNKYTNIIDWSPCCIKCKHKNINVVKEII